jgi:hypothetical protein
MGISIFILTNTYLVNSDIDDISCIECHQKELDIHSFEESCYACHSEDMTSLRVTETIYSESEEINSNCIECHSDKFIELEEGNHGVQGFDCIDCHTPHPTGTSVESFSWEKSIPIVKSSELCEQCHTTIYESWKEGAHGNINLGCVDCHDPHITEIQFKASMGIVSGVSQSLMVFVGIGILLLISLYFKIIFKIGKD